MRAESLVVVLLTAIFVCATAYCEETSSSGMVSIVVENDFFYNTDRDYTNGFALAWVSPENSTPELALRIAHWVPWFPDDGRVLHGYAVGQNMFTPRDITVADPPAGDRPYAGWLYGMMGVGAETGRQLDLFTLTVGVIGPASRAEQTQKFVHRIVDTDIPQGWDTQLRNEPGVYASYQHSWRGLSAKTLLGFDFDVTPHLGGTLGNVYTYADTGFTLRYGNKLGLDYGPPRIQPSVPGSATFIPTQGFTWYVFAGVEGRAVARNIFLDGNTFRHSRSVKKKPLVGDAQWGIVLTWRDYRLSFTHVVRTREFETQGGSDQFGSFSLSMGI
jgi:lipid A 3-O-deacylase